MRRRQIILGFPMAVAADFLLQRLLIFLARVTFHARADWVAQGYLLVLCTIVVAAACRLVYEATQGDTGIRSGDLVLRRNEKVKVKRERCQFGGQTGTLVAVKGRQLYRTAPTTYGQIGRLFCVRFSDKETAEIEEDFLEKP